MRFKTIFFILLFIFIFGTSQQVQASGNVYGWAWSENIGWISFNCANQGVCDVSDYGVNLDLNNGKFSGYAWSENIGWISFNESDTGTPPSNDPCPDPSCIAKADPPGQLGNTDVSILGWARALAYGGDWDGWIRFDHGQSGEVYIDSNGDFHNWAWAGDVIGWISFNCAEGGDCSQSDYKVYISGGLNQPPLAKNLKDPDNSETYCGVGPGKGLITFEWTYEDPDGDNEIRFDFRVNDINNVDDPNPEIDREIAGLNNPSPTVNTQTAFVGTELDYGQTYYWWVRVWDEKGNNSGWVAGPSFDTPAHAYPYPDFSWDPLEPSVGEEVQFSDNSSAYGGATIVSWNWTFQDGQPPISSEQNPVVQFTSKGTKTVSLKVTDSSGFQCSTSKSVTVEIGFPWWQEIAPVSYIRKFLAAIFSKI